MQHNVFSLDEITVASKLFRAASQMTAQGTAMITVHPGLAELELTVSNLRRLEPVPEDQQLFVSGPANYTVYHVWLAGSKVEPLYLGSFNAPQFGQGRFFYTFDPENVNNSGFTLSKCKWLLITASPGSRHNLWLGEAAAGVLYGCIPLAQNLATRADPPMALFVTHKKPGLDDESELDLELFDEDEDDDIKTTHKRKRYKRRQLNGTPAELAFPDRDEDDDGLEP